jgi:glyoxylase-like metal-dependent hydrolase (beta-lactamase superfamily II)
MPKTAQDRPSFRLGSFELTILSDGCYNLDAGAMFGVVPRPLWSRRITPDEQNRYRAGLNSVLVRAEGKVVLIETGIGNKLAPKLRAIHGHEERLLSSLAAAGLAPDDVDVVINSHLHFDHCGWNTTVRDGQVVPTFPRARYYAPRGEWEHGAKRLERDRVSYLSDNYDPLIQSGQMTLLEGDGEILPGIAVQIFPGHTRSMQAILLESGGQTACYISDLIPTSHHLDLTWLMAFDLFPLETIESKKRYYARAVPGRWLTIFTHDHQVPWGYIEAAGPGKYVLAGRPED